MSNATGTWTDARTAGKRPTAVVLALGVWLAVSPWVLGHTSDGAWIVEDGFAALLVLAAATGLATRVTQIMSMGVTLLGLLLALTPYTLFNASFAKHPAVLFDDMLVGFVVVAAGAVAAKQASRALDA